MTRFGPIVLMALLALGGCGSSEEDDIRVQERAEARAVQTRGFVDDLVTRLDGMEAEVVVTEDSTFACDLALDDSGLLHNYNVRFEVVAGGIDRLQVPIADEMEAEGWTVRRDPIDQGLVSVRFLKNTFSIGASISQKTGNATAGGSGGCVE